jgi:hypothetical protein
MSEIPSPPPEESKLRGSLVPSEATSSGEPVEQQESLLRGSLLHPDKSEAGEPAGLPSQLIHRDSGEAYQIVGETETRYGVMVKLKAPDGHTVTLNRDHILGALNEDGSPWSRPPAA